MKIGVITWFKYENYGTVLQAVAMQKYLKSQGYDVELVDFEADDSYKRKKSFFYEKFGRLIFKIENKLYKEEFIKRSNDFKKIIKENCKISKKVNNKDEYIEICNKYDVLLFGSDQIWNPLWYNPFYYANFEEINTKLVAYAPSFGVNYIADDKKSNISKALKRFDFFGMREQRGCEIVKELIGKDVNTVVDPTFLLDKNEWKDIEEDIPEVKEKYILCYFLGDNKNHWKAVKKFANKKKMKLIVIPNITNGYSYIQSKNTLKSVNVGNYISLIKNAEYIVTDSFHGAVFSIIYQKNFSLFERHNPKAGASQNSRLYNLLDMANINFVLVNFGDNNIIENKINYDEVNKRISLKINESKNYLKNSLKEG